MNVCAVGPVAGPLRVATAPFWMCTGKLSSSVAVPLASVRSLCVATNGASGAARGERSAASTSARGAPRTISEPSSSEPASPPAVALIDALSPSASVAVTSTLSPGTTNRPPAETESRLAGAPPEQLTAEPSARQRSGLVGASDEIVSGSKKRSPKS